MLFTTELKVELENKFRNVVEIWTCKQLTKAVKWSVRPRVRAFVDIVILITTITFTSMSPNSRPTFVWNKV